MWNGLRGLISSHGFLRSRSSWLRGRCVFRVGVGKPVFVLSLAPRESRLSQGLRIKQTPLSRGLFCWRKAGDSNPRYPEGYNSFRDCPDRPLRQLSFYCFATRIFSLLCLLSLLCFPSHCCAFFFVAHLCTGRSSFIAVSWPRFLFQRPG